MTDYFTEQRRFYPEEADALTETALSEAPRGLTAEDFFPTDIFHGQVATSAPIPQMLTVKELAEEVKAFGVSEYYIRCAVKQNKFPYITAGRKVLINRDIFIKHLNAELHG